MRGSEIQKISWWVKDRDLGIKGVYRREEKGIYLRCGC